MDCPIFHGPLLALGIEVTSEIKNKRIFKMLYTIAVVLLILWVLGLVSSYTMGGFIHVFLVVALIVLVIGFLQGRKV